MPRTSTKPKAGGRPTLLTPRREEQLLNLIEDGNHITTACAYVGISQATFYRWLDRAADADQLADQGKTVPPHLRVYREFRDRLALARARAEDRAVGVIKTAMLGGFVTSEEPIQDINGEVKYDAHGEVLWKRTFTAPDGRLALAYLARSAPDRWGTQATRVELSGPGGAPVQVEQMGQVSSLAEQLQAVRARRSATRELDAAEAGEVEDAEVLDGDGG